MKYNPEIHHRKSIRLKDYDYSQSGAYFITICCENKLNRFGEINIVNLKSNTVGAVFTPALFDNTQSNQLQNNKINHIEKGQPPVGAIPCGCPFPHTGCPPPTIAKIIGSYKSLVSNKCLKISKTNNDILGKFWQRNYYEHIIRNEKSYQAIAEYIINNPLKWQEDKYYNI